MKITVSLLLTILVISCSIKAKNDLENLDSIFASDKIEIEILEDVCFGANSNNWMLTKEKSDHWILSSDSIQFITEIKNSQIDSLKNHLKTRMGQNLFGGCTSVTYIKVGTKWRFVQYQHSFCSGPEFKALYNILNLE